MTMTMIEPKQGGAMGADMFRVTKAKHRIRVFPFDHDGDGQLAAYHRMHFTDAGPVPYSPEIEEEARRKNDKRMKAVHRYSLAVVDTDEDPTKVLRYDAPTTVYRAIHAILNEDEVDAEDYLGNDGNDFIIKHDKNQQPQNQYTVTLRLKGSSVLDIDDDDVPDMIEEVENMGGPVVEDGDDDDDDDVPDADDDEGDDDDEEDDDSNSKDEDEDEDDEEEAQAPKKKAKAKSSKKRTPAKRKPVKEDEGYEFEDDDNNIVFKKGKKEIEGIWTGKKKNGKFIVEVDGALQFVSPANVVYREED